MHMHMHMHNMYMHMYMYIDLRMDCTWDISTRDSTPYGCSLSDLLTS